MKKSKTLILSLLSLLPMTLGGLVGCSVSSNGGTNSSNNGGSSPSMDEEDPTVTSLTLLANPTKLTYDVGETFDPTGARLKAVWSDGEDEEISGAECSFSPTGPLTADVTSVTLTYENASISIDITVNNSALKSISVDTTSIKTHTIEGNYIDLTQIKVLAQYFDTSKNKEVTSFELYEGETKIENPSLYEVKKGRHTIIVKYLDKTVSFLVTGFTGIAVNFNSKSIHTNATETSSELPFFVEKANTVKSYQKIDNDWNHETQVNAYRVSDNYGITDIKALAKIRIHVYSSVASYAKISLNAGGYNITRPDKGWTSDMYLNQACTLNVNDVTTDVKDGLLPANTTKEQMDKGEMGTWMPKFVDVDFAETRLKQGDNVFEINVNDFYYKNGSSQKYGETYFAIKSMTFEYIDAGEHTHNYQLMKDENSHWQECLICGDKKDEAKHSFSSIKIVKNPTNVDYEEGEIPNLEGIEVDGVCTCGDVNVTKNITANLNELRLDSSDSKTEQKQIKISCGSLSANLTITVHKTFSFAGGAKKDDSSQYYLENASDSNKNFSIWSSGTIGDLKADTELKYHVYAPYAGKYSLSIVGASQCSNAERVKGKDKDGKEVDFVKESFDMYADKFMTLNVNGTDTSFLSDAKFDGITLPSDFQQQGITSSVYVLGHYTKAVVAKDLELKEGDNVITLKTKSKDEILYQNKYRTAWTDNQEATINIKNVAIAYYGE